MIASNDGGVTVTIDGGKTWTRQAWDRYVAEAVNQARVRGDELHALLRDAQRLEHLAAAV